jgi:hypothetical protein
MFFIFSIGHELPVKEINEESIKIISEVKGASITCSTLHSINPI